MKIFALQKLLQSISCFMCFSIASKNCDLVFMNYGGYVVGSLLDANDVACRLFLGAIILSFVFLPSRGVRRVGSITFVSAAQCL